MPQGLGSGIQAAAFAQKPNKQLAVIQLDANGNLAGIGGDADSAVYNPGSSSSALAYLKGMVDLQENVAASGAAVMSNALQVFTIAGGAIQILALFSLCITANDTTASTLQWKNTVTLGTLSQTITGASASLASAAIGETVVAQLTALSTAPLVNANGAGILGTTGNMLCLPGTLGLVIGTGSTTGTWEHFIRYRPLAKGVTVTNLF
jgi:hypothetical protein